MENKAFSSMAKAKQWAHLVKSEMDRGISLSTSDAKAMTLQEAFDKYSAEVAPLKKIGQQCPLAAN